MNRLIASVFLISIANTVTVLGYSTDDYFWRDYDGTLPSDALPGGMDPYGKPLYIGQVIFEHKLIPGRIYENNANIYFPWGIEQKKSENVKILCTEEPDKFEWVVTRHDEIHRIRKALPFIGGYELGYMTYIGRIFVAGEMAIGRVMCHTVNMICLGLYTAKGNLQTLHTGQFEILTYKPDLMTADDHRCKIDIKLSND